MTEVFEQVATEYAAGSLNGVDYGSRVRVLMRSPTAIMYVGYGVHVSYRRTDFSSSVKRVAKAAKRPDLSSPQARAIIVAYFGEGADDAAILAATTRGRGTILVNGGGLPLPLPYAEQVKICDARYAEATPTQTLMEPQECCIQCEKPLRPHTVHHHLKTIPGEDHPRSAEDCQRLTNQTVFAIHGYARSTPEEWWSFVSWFETWDGESYRDVDFCSDRCAAIYGRRAASELSHLTPGGSPPKRNSWLHESVRHYEEEQIKWFNQP